MPVSGLDHVAIPVSRVREVLVFYGAIGFDVPTFDEVQENRIPAFSVSCGQQKINFHMPALWQRGSFDLRGPAASPGCGDFCFVWEGAEAELRLALASVGSEPILGPVRMRGGAGLGASIYARDPDENLIEFIFYNSEQLTSEVQQKIEL
jgi:catechol 2,3-dioxygenase-like lactoylglutathione lyase family enzyme